MFKVHSAWLWSTFQVVHWNIGSTWNIWTSSRLQWKLFIYTSHSETSLAATLSPPIHTHTDFSPSLARSRVILSAWTVLEDKSGCDPLCVNIRQLCGTAYWVNISVDLQKLYKPIQKENCPFSSFRIHALFQLLCGTRPLSHDENKTKTKNKKGSVCTGIYVSLRN